MAVNWLVGQGKFGVESVCLGRHIKQSEWQSGWNNAFGGPNHYDYISDYECVFPFPVNMNGLGFPANQLVNLQQLKQQGTPIQITNIAHFTNAADHIIATGGFTGGPKKINLMQLGRFSWWSPIFDENAKYTVRLHLRQVINPFLDVNDVINMQLLNQFATSDAFHPNPTRYGNVYFKYSIEDMCRFYGNHIGPQSIQFKVLGTFLYKNEIMHAVLVCSQTDGAGLFAAYPPVPTPDEVGAVVTRDANTGNWVWKPQATATEIVRLNRFAWYPMFRRWENVAFAFYLPGIGDYIAVEDLENNKYEIVSPPGSVPGSVYPPGYGNG